MDSNRCRIIVFCCLFALAASCFSAQQTFAGPLKRSPEVRDHGTGLIEPELSQNNLHEPQSESKNSQVPQSQQSMQQQSREFSTLSNILKTQSDNDKSAINNIR